MHSAAIIQAIFVSVTFTMLAVSSSKSLRDRFILYGSRANAQNVNEKDATRNHLQEPRHGGVDIKNSSSKVLDYLSTLNVSHSWFFHFYLTAVLASLFWAAQFVMKGRILSSIATAQRQHLGPSMSINQVLLTWSMMAFQESRRLYESIVFFKQSSSKMWIGHWALGVGFFLTMSVAVWIEGSNAIIQSTTMLPTFDPPGLTSFIGLCAFTLASGMQYDCHHYLSSLKKYSLPSHPMFQVLVCPHYFAECIIYLSLAMVAAPPGYILNRTIASALFFTVVNLGYTARTTRSWYEIKFGGDSVEGRWNMIPYVF